MSKYQTISEFLHAPFGVVSNPSKLTRYNTLYTSNHRSIILNAYTKIDESYYFHVKVPSETQKDGNVFYDVVIRFFTNKSDAKASSHLRDYYIQFFSNSPGFIYNYAVLYKNNGFLIESLYTKMDPRYFDKLPIKTNAKMELSFDKSIYFACRFLNEKKFKVLNKFGVSLGKKLSPESFFNEIKDFQSVKIENDLLSFERKSLRDLSKSLEKGKDTQKSNQNDRRTNDPRKKVATSSTSKEKRSVRVVKKVAGLSTAGIVKSVVKKTAGTTTRKK